VKTPTPFRFDGHGINDADGQRICKVTSCDPYIYPDGQPIRNAEFDQLSNLFATAPELLNALKDLLHVIRMPRENSDQLAGRLNSVVMDRAIEAIRKATMETDETAIRPYGPGKFNTILDSYVYSVSLDGGCDEEEGSVDEHGEWYGIMRNGRTIFRDHDPLLETLNSAEQEKLTSSVGVILREDSQGFVYVTYYAADEALEVAWSQISDHFREEETHEDTE